ncbi:MAG TPA: hypothetical protein VIX62_02235 [Actinomycetota bacterium]
MEGIEAVAAVEAPADIQGRERWYIASQTGGLWVVTTLDDSASGLILPLNNRAVTRASWGLTPHGMLPCPVTQPPTAARQ